MGNKGTNLAVHLYRGYTVCDGRDDGTVWTHSNNNSNSTSNVNDRSRAALATSHQSGLLGHGPFTEAIINHLAVQANGWREQLLYSILLSCCTACEDQKRAQDLIYWKLPRARHSAASSRETVMSKPWALLFCPMADHSPGLSIGRPHFWSIHWPTTLLVYPLADHTSGLSIGRPNSWSVPIGAPHSWYVPNGTPHSWYVPIAVCPLADHTPGLSPLAQHTTSTALPHPSPIHCHDWLRHWSPKAVSCLSVFCWS